MPNITLHIPKKLHDRMEFYNELKWTQIIRNLIEQKLKDLDNADYKLYALSKLKTDEGAEELFDF